MGKTNNNYVESIKNGLKPSKRWDHRKSRVTEEDLNTVEYLAGLGLTLHDISAC